MSAERTQGTINGNISELTLAKFTFAKRLIANVTIIMLKAITAAVKIVSADTSFVVVLCGFLK